MRVPIAGLTGRHALVAGGTGALGRAIADALAEAGAEVAVTGRSLPEPAAQDPGRFTHYVLDATDPAAAAALAAQRAAEQRPFDIVVNAIGGYRGGAPLWTDEADVLAPMLAQNLTAGYVLARAFIPAMRLRGHGAFVNIAARAGLVPPAGAGAYAASKAAAIALMESLAADLAGSGVRVNSVLPSIIDTPANRAAMPGADPARWPRPEAIARVVAFLASDAADVIHGAAVPVYGHA